MGLEIREGQAGTTGDSGKKGCGEVVRGSEFCMHNKNGYNLAEGLNDTPKHIEDTEDPPTHTHTHCWKLGHVK